MEPARKRQMLAIGQRYVANPPMRVLAHLGVLPRSHAIIETTGRRTGRPRQTPVGIGRDGDSVWVISEHGRHSAWVRNIEAQPRVRVRIGRRWFAGSGTLLDDDDPRERQRHLFSKGNARAVRRLGTDLMTVRIDLDRGD